MMRKYVAFGGAGPWTPFEDAEFDKNLGRFVCRKRPSNRSFEMTIDGKNVSPIVVHTCSANDFCCASTPWGEMEIRKSGLTRYDVLQKSALVASVKEGLSGRRMKLEFPSGDSILLKGKMLGFSRMEATRDEAYVRISAERGTRPNPGPNKQQRLRRVEFKSLSDDEKVASVESDTWIQWRISLFGLLPARDEDITKAISLDICRNRLYQESLSTIG